MSRKNKRRICFVTGTRADFGLMKSTLLAIQSHPMLELQLIITGMHLDPVHGQSIEQVRREFGEISTTVPWKSGNTPSQIAIATGSAMSDLAGAFADLKSDIVMLVGDRVEAFAAASAASVSGVPVAHIHGGDRALGQVDDMLRHAITKLSHIHFPATKNSAARLKKLGENSSRIHCVGSPGIDGIVQSAMSAGNVREKYNCPKPYSLLLLHPTDADAKLETRKVKMLLQALMKRSDRLIAIGPNNDAGSAGIVQTLSSAVSERLSFYPDVPRGDFLALMRDALFLIGNSSSGIIEAASFGTPVIDIGPRQMGREHGRNVMHSDWNIAMLEKTITSILKSRTTPKRFPARNIYGMGNTARKIATVLSQVEINQKLLRKIIAY